MASPTDRGGRNGAGMNGAKPRKRTGPEDARPERRTTRTAHDPNDNDAEPERR